LTLEEFEDARTGRSPKDQSKAFQWKPSLRRPSLFSSNGKLKPLYAVVDGKPEHHPEGVYNLRYLKAGKRVWDAVGADPQLAVTAKLRVDAVKEYLSDIGKAKSKRNPLRIHPHSQGVCIDLLQEASVSKSSRLIRAASREYTLKLTPPCSTEAPSGALRPVVGKICSAEPKPKFAEEVRRAMLEFLKATEGWTTTVASLAPNHSLE
jgi:hypothetical protein